MIHNLKILPKYFNDVKIGVKKFEIRKNDRNFEVDDLLRLREYDPLNKQYTGPCIFVRIEYITDFMQRDGYVVLGIIEPVVLD